MAREFIGLKCSCGMPGCKNELRLYKEPDSRVTIEDNEGFEFDLSREQVEGLARFLGQT